MKKPSGTKISRGSRKIAEREMLCRFAALPRVLRQEEFGYKNLQDFAKEYKVDAGTLSGWMNEEKVKEKIRNNWKEWGRDRTPDVILALYRTAVKDGKSSEVTAWMKIVDEWEEKMVTTNPELEKVASALERLASKK